MGLHSDSRWEIISDRSNSHSCSIMHLTPILFVSRASNITTRSRWIRCRRWATLCRTLSTTTRRQLRSLAWLKSKSCRKPVVKSWVSIKSVFVLTTVKSTVKLRTCSRTGLHATKCKQTCEQAAQNQWPVKTTEYFTTRCKEWLAKCTKTKTGSAPYKSKTVNTSSRRFPLVTTSAAAAKRTSP